MIRYALARLGLLVLGLVVASALIFLTLRLLPGDVAQLIAGTSATPEQVAAISARLGLDAPWPVQYLDWIGGVLRGDLGRSLVTGTPVADELAQKARVTMPLGALSLLIALLISIPFGVLAAMRRTRPSGTGLAIGAQALGFPRSGWDRPDQAIRALVLPAVTIGIVEGAMLMRFVRSATLQAVGQDYVRTAAAKGLTRTQALLRHGLPNVGLSIITVLGLQVAGIVVGAVVIEQLFALPGIGRMLVADVAARDLPKVQGELLALTAFVLVIGFVVDHVHRALDPRQREAA